MKIKIISIFIIIFIILSIFIYLTKKENPVCFFWQKKILNNCNCTYECRSENYTGWVCDQLCPQEIEYTK